MEKLITIAIPTYKRLHYLIEAVDSALSQTYENIEILIGVDPTPQGLDPEIINWIFSEVPKKQKINFFTNTINLGLAGNWNALAENAKGEYIMIIGDDDRLLPDCVSSLMRGINQGADVSCSNHYIIDSSGNRLEPFDEYTVQFNRNDLQEGFLSNQQSKIWQNAISITSSLIKTLLVREFKFKEDLNTPEIELFLRLDQNNCKFYFTPSYLVEYRVHSQSATASGLKVHRLMNYLIKFPVKSYNYKFKKKFLYSLASVSIKNLILDGNKKEALYILFSDYYGIRRILSPKGLLFLIMLFLPHWLNSKIVKLKG